jgi:hypothetical protein
MSGSKVILALKPFRQGIFGIRPTAWPEDTIAKKI